MEVTTPNPTGAAKPGGKSQQILTEIPSSLRTLARLVVRGFHEIEDTLVIDMLVRYPCLREDDISALLKFDKKNLRSRMARLKNDKFVQVCNIGIMMRFQCWIGDKRERYVREI